MGKVGYFVLVLLLAPLFWGAVYTWAISLWLVALVILVVQVPYEWFRGPRIIEYSFYSLIVLFILIIVLQTLPGGFSVVPNSIWQLAEQALEGDITYSSATNLSALIWNLGTVGLYITVFWAALAVGGDYHRVLFFFRWLLWGTALLVTLTLMIHLGNNELLLWQLRDFPSDVFTHGFINRNTTASYLGTFSLLCIGLLIRSFRNMHLSSLRLTPGLVEEILPYILKQIVPYLAAITVFSIGLMLTGSRAGILFTGVSILFLLLLLLVKSSSGPFFKTVLGLIILCASIWVFANWGGTFSKRFDSAGLELRNRAAVYEATRRMIGDYPYLGVGLGGFTSNFPVYRPTTLSSQTFYDKAHNTYLEVTAEMGIPFSLALGAFWIGIFVVLIRGYLMRRQRYIFSAVGASVWLLASLHSLVDFPLQIPGHAMVVAAIIGVCIAQTVHHKRR